MVKKKLAHFTENLTFAHLFQYPHMDQLTDFPHRGMWRSGYFHNENPVIVELGCGKGEYTVNLAIMHPEKNYIGLDIKGARLWKGCKMVQENGVRNAAFIRSRVEFIEFFFNADEVDGIWLTFPDPQPQSNRIKKRLTSPEFIERYKKILKPEGIIHLKTDDTGLYNYTLSVIRESGHKLLFASEDINRLEEPHPGKDIQTFYEDMFLRQGIPIKYAEFSLNHEN